MEKVKLDTSKCIGCGACVAIAPDTFKFNDKGQSTVQNDTVTENARQAAESCPMQIITIEDDKKEN